MAARATREFDSDPWFAAVSCEVPLTPDSDFFTTTAQIIPVIILALVVEDRYIKHHATLLARWAAIAQPVALSVLMAGEVAALTGVVGEGSATAATFVLVVLGFGGGQLVLPIVYDGLWPATRPLTTQERILAYGGTAVAWVTLGLPIVSAIVAAFVVSGSGSGSGS